MSDQNADWESSIAMSASDLTFVEAASSSAVFDDSADLCESSEGSLFNASSVDGDSIDDFNGIALPTPLPPNTAKECH